MGSICRTLFLEICQKRASGKNTGATLRDRREKGNLIQTTHIPFHLMLHSTLLIPVTLLSRHNREFGINEIIMNYLTRRIRKCHDMKNIYRTRIFFFFRIYL